MLNWKQKFRWKWTKVPEVKIKNLTIITIWSFYTALKTVISDVIPSDKHPYSDNKDEEIEAILSPLSIVSRMVPDVYQMMLGNKVLIELKRKIKDIIK